jgi:hypothetical protein
MRRRNGLIGRGTRDGLVGEALVGVSVIGVFLRLE